MSYSDLDDLTVGTFDHLSSDTFMELEIDNIFPNPNQPRKQFDDNYIDELSQSIVENGLIQPIAVSACDDGTFMIVSGECRYKAHIKAGLRSIKTHILNIDNKKVDELSLIENIQRKDLTPFEVARFINLLWSSGNYAKKQDLAKAVGKSATYISKVFKAVNICDEIIKDIEDTKKDIGLETLQELSNVKDIQKQKEFYFNNTKRDIIRQYLSSLKDTKKVANKKYKKIVNCSELKKWEDILEHLKPLNILNKQYKITIQEL
jgi:ParB/RepB/Spo0J family partition protein